MQKELKRSSYKKEDLEVLKSAVKDLEKAISNIRNNLESEYKTNQILSDGFYLTEKSQKMNIRLSSIINKEKFNQIIKDLERRI